MTMEEFSTQGLFLPGGDLDLGGKQWLDAQAGDLQSPGSYTAIPTRSLARCEVPREGWRDSRLLHKKAARVTLITMPESGACCGMKEESGVLSHRTVPCKC